MAEIIMIGALVAAVIVLTIQRDRYARQLRNARDLLWYGDTANAKRGAERFPPGTIPVELASRIGELWRLKLGFEASAARVARLVSVAHKAMCEFEPTTEAVYFNDGDRGAPASVRCRAHQARGCTHPDCACEAVEPEPPALVRPQPNKPGRKG